MGRLLGLLAVLLLLVAGWIGVRGFLAYGHAQDAAEGLRSVQASVEGGDVEAGRSELGGVQRDTAAMVRLTSDPVWRAVAAFPYGGQNLAAVSTAASASNDVTQRGLPSLLNAAQGLQDFGSGLQGGSLDTGALQGTVDGVNRADASLAAAREKLGSVDRAYLLPQVDRALTELESSLDLAASLRQSVAGQLPTG